MRAGRVSTFLRFRSARRAVLDNGGRISTASGRGGDILPADMAAVNRGAQGGNNIGRGLDRRQAGNGRRGAGLCAAAEIAVQDHLAAVMARPWPFCRGLWDRASMSPAISSSIRASCGAVGRVPSAWPAGLGAAAGPF